MRALECHQHPRSLITSADGARSEAFGSCMCDAVSPAQSLVLTVMMLQMNSKCRQMMLLLWEILETMSWSMQLHRH